MKLVSLAKYHKIDVLLIQEHNVKDVKTLNHLSSYFEIILNPTNNIKGGTAIFICKNCPFEVISKDLDVEGQIIGCKIGYNDIVIPVLNVYAPSGTNKSKDREDFFSDKILFYLRHNIDNLIFGGDFNCVTSQKDCSKGKDTTCSKALQNLIKNLGLKDVTRVSNGIPEYTYVRENYASRLDRLYTKELFPKILSYSTIPISFSDHSMILANIKIDNLRTGKGYWKLNSSILEYQGIEEDFKEFWCFMKSKKCNFRNILDWWEFAKKECKSFFMKLSKRISNEKYGLLNLLQNRLRKIYEQSYAFNIEFHKIKLLKERINEIQNQLCEGVKLRAKIKDQVDGEKISAHLLGREKNWNGNRNMSKIKGDNGLIIKDTDAIMLFLKGHFEKMYEYKEGDDKSQTYLLDKCTTKLDDDDNDMLNNDIDLEELWNAIKRMKSGKSPGNDGITIEFYKKFWKVIKNDFIEVVRYVLEHERLSTSQYEGTIKLGPKGGDPELIQNWRPISLLNVDYKIISKTLSDRLKQVMGKIISKEQYCGIPDRSIIHCNNTMRDIINYVRDNDLQAGLLNLDWSKAFDRVNLSFLFNVMKKFGFSDKFIKWIKTLYKDCKSSICVNGLLTSNFSIQRSVRQGCPLSMLLYVIFQEPLYIAIKENKRIITPRMPNGMRIPIQGYADDSTIIFSLDNSLFEIFEEIKHFENATGAQLNKDKTCIMGIGMWTGRNTWPIAWLNTVEYSKILGIYFHNSYLETCEKNWTIIIEKVTKSINMLRQRYLSLFQKAILINSLILSKVWYVAHTLHLRKILAKRINASIFQYLWCGMYQPIKRNTLCLPKKEGGLGIHNVIEKAISLLSSSCLKEVLNGVGLSRYYCIIRLSHMIDPIHLDEVSYCPPVYYSIAIESIRKVYHHKNFPLIKSKDIYQSLLPYATPLMEMNYPLNDWHEIWQNVNHFLIGVEERGFIYRYIHESLATNQRLQLLKIRDNGNCESCGNPENAFHIFYFCKTIKYVVNWFERVVRDTCELESYNWLKILLYDIKGKSRKDRNTTIILITTYLYCLWISRKKGHNISQSIGFLKGRLYYQRWLMRNIFGNNIKLYITTKYQDYVF